jgi:hypothetical protein
LAKRKKTAEEEYANIKEKLKSETSHNKIKNTLIPQIERLTETYCNLLKFTATRQLPQQKI